MAIPVHTVDILGASLLSDPSKLKVGFFSVVLPAGNGATTGVAMINGGEDFTSLPAVTSPVGTGTTFTPVMAIEESGVGAGGAGYVVGDQVTLTGGTATEAAILDITEVDGNGAVLAYTLVNDGGLYTALAGGNLTQASTTGAGTGFTLAVTGYRVADVTFTNASATGYVQGTQLVFTGGGGRFAAAELAVEPSNEPAEVFVPIDDLPPHALIFVQPDTFCGYRVLERNTFGVTLSFAGVTGGEMPTRAGVLVVG